MLEGIWGLSGLIPIRFRAAGAFAAGDTFQVDGADFEACTPAGGAPGDGAFAAGAQVLALADMEGKKICLSGGDAAAASASLQTAALQAETDTAVVETDYRLLMVENEII